MYQHVCTVIPSHTWRWVGAMILSISFFFIGSAHALGFSLALPTPISSNHLVRYADRLGLIDSQRRAIEAFHDRYKEEFEALSDGQIARFRRESQVLAGMGDMVKREDLEKFLRRADRLIARIQEIDDRLFDQIQTVLSDEQLIRLPDVRLSRERDRYRAPHALDLMKWPKAELRQILLDIELSPAEREVIDPILSQYERFLTSGLRDLSKISRSTYPRVAEAMHELGHSHERGENTEVAERVLTDLLKKRLIRINRVRDLDFQTYKDLAALLSPDKARALRDRFHAKEYRDTLLVIGWRVRAQREYGQALGSDEISDEQREVIEAVALETQFRLDGVLETAVRVVREYNRTFVPVTIDKEASECYLEKLYELRSRATDIDRNAITTLHAILGEELTEEFRAVRQMSAERGARQRPGYGERAVAPQAVKDPKSESLISGIRRPDAFLPNPINQQDLALYAWLLRLSDGQRAALGQMHKEYRELFERTAGPSIDAVTEAQRNLSRTEDRAASESVDDLFDLRQRALEVIRQADSAFFQTLEALAPAEEEELVLDQVYRARERETYHSYEWRHSPASTNASRIDLLWLIYEQRLPATELKEVADLLGTYEEALTSLVRTRFDHRLNEQRGVEQYVAESRRLRAAGAGDEEMSELFRRTDPVISDLTSKVRQVNLLITELNQETLAEMISILPQDTGRSLHDAFDHRAYPNVYRDPTELDRSLTAALHLDDLTDQQRSMLDDLAAQYRPAYRQLCEQMVQVVADADRGDHEKGATHPDPQVAMKNLLFKRNELNVRTVTQLRSQLRDEQIKRIGPLPDPAAANE